MTNHQATEPTDARYEINRHIRVLWGAKVTDSDGRWTGWGIWDDFDDGLAQVYRTLPEALLAAKQLAAEYSNGDR